MIFINGLCQTTLAMATVWTGCQSMPAAQQYINSQDNQTIEASAQDASAKTVTLLDNQKMTVALPVDWTLLPTTISTATSTANKQTATTVELVSTRSQEHTKILLTITPKNVMDVSSMTPSELRQAVQRGAIAMQPQAVVSTINVR